MGVGWCRARALRAHRMFQRKLFKRNPMDFAQPPHSLSHINTYKLRLPTLTHMENFWIFPRHKWNRRNGQQKKNKTRLRHTNTANDTTIRFSCMLCECTQANCSPKPKIVSHAMVKGRYFASRSYIMYVCHRSGWPEPWRQAEYSKNDMEIYYIIINCEKREWIFALKYY